MTNLMLRRFINMPGLISVLNSWLMLWLLLASKGVGSLLLIPRKANELMNLMLKKK